MKFKIDRRKWLRGEEHYNSRLLRPVDGKMCCLGQVALQCGLTKDAITNKAAPFNITFIERSKLPKWIRSDQSTLLYDAMTINDKRGISDEIRETKLKDIFKSAGDSITFNH